MAKLPVTWWEIVFYGVCFLGIAAGMIFWSHFWRRNPELAREIREPYNQMLPQPQTEFEWKMRRVFTSPTIADSIGHFLYFGFAVAATTVGLTCISGGILGSIHGIPLHFLALERFVIACFVGALILVVLCMSLRTIPNQ